MSSASLKDCRLTRHAHQISYTKVYSKSLAPAKPSHAGPSPRPGGRRNRRRGAGRRNYLSTHFGVDTEDYAGLPPGPGREEVFYNCQACHSLKLVLQQRLSREGWDETLVWMVEEQDMPQPDPEERKIILDYLGTYLSDKTPR